MSAHTDHETACGTDWESVQAELADVPGEAGIRRRAEAYASFFLRLGRDVRIGPGCRFTHPGQIVLEDDVRINDGALIYGSGGVWIGRHARLGPRLFIHSANHDVRPGGLAYFERGYDFASVVLGDNCLVSARVSILPGARLASGSFVACGAVVPKGVYPDGAALLGVPAKVRPASRVPEVPPDAPSIVVVTPGDGVWADAARLLVEGLGLPQVAVLRAGARRPASAHTRLAIGPEGWTPDGGAEDGRTWRLASVRMLPEGAARLVRPGPAGAGAAEVPDARRHVFVPVRDPAASVADNACALSWYYAIKRWRKRADHGTDADRLELCLAVAALRADPGATAAGLTDELETLLPDADPGPDEGRAAIAALRAWAPGGGGAPGAALAETLAPLADVSESVLVRLRSGEVAGYQDATYRQRPELAGIVALKVGRGGAPELAGRIAALLPETTKALAVAYYGLAALLLGDAGLVRRCAERLYSTEFLDETTGCVRSVVGRPGLCYAPALATFLVLAEQIERPEFRLRRQCTIVEPLRWTCLDAGETAWSVDVGAERGPLVDPGQRRIARSLLENWLLAVSVPGVERMQYELLEPCYEPVAATLEAVWTSVFRAMQHAAGEPLVRVRPWPFGARAALSVRYDIDRAVTADRIACHARIQSATLNAACGSWYAIPGTAFGDRAASLLPRFLQEVGVHGCTLDAGVRGRGVTCHSAPNSAYWRGRVSVAAQETAGADHGEMLAGQLSRPRRGWLGDGTGGRATDLWLTPIHFPLEGSTGDTDLSYFDRLAHRFHALVAAGGHVIVGSHPDLEPALLERLLEREDLAGVWCAPVRAVVDRCRALLSSGAVRVVGVVDGGVDLVATSTIADVHLEIDRPGASTPEHLAVQLNAGAPRRVTWTA